MKPTHILQQVKKTYTRIADEFDVARSRPWPEFKDFLKELRKREKASRTLRVLDVGCGNGRLFHFFTLRQAQGDIEPIDYVGIDNNREMLRIAKKNAPAARVRFGDILKLPFPPHSFDIVFAIAVLHHLPTNALHIKALKEMKRILKKHGLLAITVWNLWQGKYRKYISGKKAIVPWGARIKRFYYAFQETKLKNLFKKAGFKKIKKIKSKYNFAFLIE